MNKKTILTSFLLCFSLSFFSLNAFNNGLWMDIYGSDIESTTTIFIQNNQQTSADLVIQKLYSSLEKYKVSIKKGYITDGNLDYYLLSTDYDSYFSNFPLIKKLDVNWTDFSTDVYYATDSSDQLSSGVFYTVYPINLKSITYHNFSNIINGNVDPFGYYNISGSNKEEQTAFVSYLQGSLPGIVSIVELDFDSSINESPKLAVLFISSILFLLILLMEVSKNMKEISLRKALGESFFRIEYDLFKSFFVSVLVSSVIAYFISYLVLIRAFNTYTIEYIWMLVQSFCLVTLITLILLCFIGLTLFVVSPIDVIKNRDFSKTLYNFNFLLKIAFIVLLFPEFLVFTQKIISQSEAVIAYIQANDELLSVVRFGGINPVASTGNGGWAESIRLNQKVIAYEKDNGATFINYAVMTTPDNITPDSKEYSLYEYVEITSDYSEFLPTKMQEIIAQNKNEKFVMVNKNALEQIKYKIEDICMDCKIVVTDLNYRVIDYRLIGLPYLRNPVLVIYPNLDSVHNLNIEDMYFITPSPDEAEVLMFQATKDLGYQITFTNGNNIVTPRLTQAKISWYYTFIVFIEGLLVLFLITSHGITVLYDLNKKEIAIHYLSGYSFMQRSAYIVLQDSMLFGLLWFYLTTKKFGFHESLYYAVVVMVVNLIIASIHLVKNEKKKAIDAIKNS